MPSQLGELTYTGSTQSPTWKNYDSTKLTISGKTSATDAGDYTVTFTPVTGYAWSDGSTGSKSVSWIIGKAVGTLSIEPTSLEFTDVGATNAQMIQATSNIPGDVEAVSGDENVASVTSSGKIVTVTPVGDGETDITVSMLGDVNHVAPSSLLCGVGVSSVYTGPSVDATADEFARTIRSGNGPSAFAVGDLVGIPINGEFNAITSGSDSTAIAIALSGTYYGSLLGFNHNQPTEGTGNYVDIQLLQDKDTGTPLCFGPASGGYQMNTTGTNVGGPKDSYMYKTTLPKLLALIDAAWKNCLVDVTKYVDNVGNNSNKAASVTALLSKLFLLSEFEIWGIRSAANPYERDKQQQYTMYINGVIKRRKEQVNKAKDVGWWMSSPYSSNAVSFTFVNNGGVYSATNAAGACGIAPGFRIG